MNKKQTFSQAPLSKSFAIYQALKEEFTSGQWRFGEKISIARIAERFAVSRRPVLDAMKMLENEGLVEIIPQTGCKVIDYSKKSVYDHFLISAVLEGLSAELAAKQRLDEEIVELEKYNAEMKQVFMQGMYEKTDFFKYNRMIHDKILFMSRSHELAQIAVRMWDKNDFFIFNLYEQFHVFVQEAWNSHDSIIAAIKQQHPSEARALMEAHVQSYVTRLMQVLPTT